MNKMMMMMMMMMTPEHIRVMRSWSGSC